jgi:hypothetical protein
MRAHNRDLFEYHIAQFRNCKGRERQLHYDQVLLRCEKHAMQRTVELLQSIPEPGKRKHDVSEGSDALDTDISQDSSDESTSSSEEEDLGPNDEDVPLMSSTEVDEFVKTESGVCAKTQDRNRALCMLVWIKCTESDAWKHRFSTHIKPNNDDFDADEFFAMTRWDQGQRNTRFCINYSKLDKDMVYTFLTGEIRHTSDVHVAGGKARGSRIAEECKRNKIAGAALARQAACGRD